MLKSIFRKSFINISFVGIGNVFNAGLGFLFLTAVARSVSVEDFGKYSLLTVLLIFTTKIMDFGTNSLFVARSIETDDKKLADHFISVKMVLFLIALPVSLLALYFLGLFSPAIIAAFVLGLIFYGINFTLFGLFQKIERYTILVLLNTIPASIKGLFAFLIFFGIVNMSYLDYFLVFSLCIGPSALLFFFLPKEMKDFNTNFSKIKETLKEALSPGISQLINEGFPAVNNSLAKIYSNFATVGIFSLADKISSIFSLVSFTIFTVLLPKNAQRKRQKAGYDFSETKILAGGVMLLALITIGTAYLAIPWFFDNKFNESLPILNVLVIASAISAIHVFLENYFYVQAKTSYLAAISAGKLFLLIALSVVLIPMFSVMGIAWAQLFSSVAGLGTIVWFIKADKKTS